MRIVFVVNQVNDENKSALRNVKEVDVVILRHEVPSNIEKIYRGVVIKRATRNCFVSKVAIVEENSNGHYCISIVETNYLVTKSKIKEGQ